MIPLRDDAPRLSFPFVTLVLIAINVGIFFYQFSLGMESRGAMAAFVETYGAIPLRTTASLTGQYPFLPGVVPVFTSIFLLGGWLHLIGYMWFLWIFVDNFEVELGHFSYVIFYLACGILASLAHYFSDPHSAIPSIGASGAIAGVMGAYVVRFPRARIVTLIPIFIIWTTIEIPAIFMLFYWFAIQVMSGTASYSMNDSGGVAWWAHVGGFVAGAILIWSRPKRRRLRQAYSVRYR
jgi:membrane associated rhomboid family serine protease